MKYFNLAFIIFFAMIVTTIVGLKKSTFRNKNKALMTAMTKTAAKVLAKVMYDDAIKKELYKTLFTAIINDKPIGTADNSPSITCISIARKAAEKSPQLLPVYYFDMFVETQNLEQDLKFKTKLIFQNQQNEEVKRCEERIIDTTDQEKYNKVVQDLRKKIRDLLQPYKTKIAATSNELITSIISVHRDLATKTLYKKLNHEEP